MNRNKYNYNSIHKYNYLRNEVSGITLCGRIYSTRCFCISCVMGYYLTFANFAEFHIDLFFLLLKLQDSCR